MNTRQLDIIKLLERQDTWTTSTQLAEKLKCSNKTIQKDIKYMREKLPDEWTITSKKGYGIKLDKPNDLTFEVVHKSSERPNFQTNLKQEITEHILRETYPTIESLAFALFYNTKTIQNKVNAIEVELNKHQLILSRKPLKIIGDEIDIRMFIYNYILDKYGDHSLFNKYYPDYYDDIRLIYSKEISKKVALSSLQLTKLFIFIDISIERFKTGHPISLPERYKFVLDHPFYLDLLPLFSNLENKHQITLTQSEKTFFFYAFVHSDFFYTFSEAEKTKTLQLLKDPKSDYHLISDFINALADEFKLDLWKNEYFILSITILIENIKLRNTFPIFNRITARKSSIEIAKALNKEYNLIKTFCRQWEDKLHLNFSKESLSIILNLITQHKYKYKAYSRKTLFIHSQSKLVKDLTLKILNHEFSNRLKITSWPIHQIDEVDLDNYTCILTDTPLNNFREKSGDLEDKNIFLINSIPTEQQLSQIRRELNKKNS